MSISSLYNVILSTYVSEKSSRMADKHKQLVFKVMPMANKYQIKDAVEKSFDVKVESVQICRYQGKKRNFAQIPGKRKQWKKAYVTLKEGYDIELSGGKS